jgi:hypothetical protein
MRLATTRSGVRSCGSTTARASSEIGGDTLESLEVALRRHFERVEIRQHGKVALFVARDAMTANRS